jgi:hypothetical protein
VGLAVADVDRVVAGEIEVDDGDLSNYHVLHGGRVEGSPLASTSPCNCVAARLRFDDGSWCAGLKILLLVNFRSGATSWPSSASVACWG